MSDMKFTGPANAALLRINGGFLAVTGLGAFINDLMSYFHGVGMFGKTLFQNSIAIGQTEAHGLALLTGIAVFVLRQSQAARYFHWHLIVLHILLGGCNILFFEAFTVADLYAFGYFITAVHFIFVFANMLALRRGSAAAQ